MLSDHTIVRSYIFSLESIFLYHCARSQCIYSSRRNSAEWSIGRGVVPAEPSVCPRGLAVDSTAVLNSHQTIFAVLTLSAHVFHRTLSCLTVEIELFQKLWILPFAENFDNLPNIHHITAHCWACYKRKPKWPSLSMRGGKLNFANQNFINFISVRRDHLVNTTKLCIDKSTIFSCPEIWYWYCFENQKVIWNLHLESTASLS